MKKKYSKKKIMQVLFLIYSIGMIFLLFGRQKYWVDSNYWKSFSYSRCVVVWMWTI